MELTNKYFIKTLFFFLVLFGLHIVIIMIAPYEDDSFIVDNYDGNNLFQSMFSSNNQQAFPFTVNDFPRFKEIRHFNSFVDSNSDADFPTIVKFDIDGQNKSDVKDKNVVENINNKNAYSYNQSQQKEINSSNTQYYLTDNKSLQTNKIFTSNNNSIQSSVGFSTKKHSISNSVSNSFLANNTLIINANYSEYNSLMLVNGDTNPGDPGVPIGDGTWVLMLLAVGYGFIKKYPIDVF